MQPATMLRAAMERQRKLPVIQIKRNVTVIPGDKPQTPSFSHIEKLLIFLGAGGVVYYINKHYMFKNNYQIPFLPDQRFGGDLPIVESPLPIPNAGDPETISPTLISPKDVSAIEVFEHDLKNAISTAMEKVSHVTSTQVKSLRSHFHDNSSSLGSVLEITNSHKYVDKLDNLIQEARNEPKSKHHPLLPLADATSKKLHDQLDELEKVHVAHSYLH